MNVVIKAEEFTNYLKENNLVIVHKSIIEDEKSLEFLRMQKELMRKDALTPGEIVKAKLLFPQISGTHGILKTNKIKPEERFKNKNGKGQWMICTSAIKRLRKQFGYAAL